MITKIYLSEDDSWKNIYESNDFDNGIVLKKEKLDYSNQWNDVDLLSDLLEKISLKFGKDSLKSVKLIGQLIDYQCEVEFIGDIIKECLSYKCLKNDFLLNCIKFIKKYTELQLYYIFNLSFYIYYLKYNKTKIISCDFNDIISFKKLTFEKNPELFGYDNIKDEIERCKNLEFSIKEMKKDIVFFFKSVIPVFNDLNSILGTKRIKKIDYNDLKNQYGHLLTILEKKELKLNSSIKEKDDFNEKKLYSTYSNVLGYLVLYIQNDMSIIDKYIDDNKYSFIQKKRDLKKRRERFAMIDVYIEKLRKQIS